MTPLQRQLQELDEDIYMQRQLVKSLQSDINDTPRLKRWIEERRERIAKLQSEIDLLQGRIDNGPDLYEEAVSRLQLLNAKRQELGSTGIRTKKAKLKAALKAAEAAGISKEQIMALLSAQEEPEC